MRPVAPEGPGASCEGLHITIAVNFAIITALLDVKSDAKEGRRFAPMEVGQMQLVEAWRLTCDTRSTREASASCEACTHNSCQLCYGSTLYKS